MDVDVHHDLAAVEELFPYLDAHWRDYVVERGLPGFDTNYYPQASPMSVRPDLLRPDGPPPATDPATVAADVLDRTGSSTAILNCLYGVQPMQNEYLAAALSSALNDWQRERWLAVDPRLRASIVVPTQNAELAAREIDRTAADGAFVQVLMFVRDRMQLGKRFFWPIYEAAERHGLPIAVHPFGSFNHPNTPAGWASTYIEEYVAQAQLFHAQVVSIVCQGVLARFPELRFVLLESGASWLPPLMWRFDKDWKGLRHDTPWVDRAPSDLIRRHFRLATAPLDVEGPDGLLRLIDQLGSDEMLLYSSDYPHHHHDPGVGSVLGLPDDLRQKVLSGNARALYPLDRGGHR
ncbi:amidohydrolase family protein [Pseudonocardia sp. RS11V-5]|uniref:amidohydrolase family protein n=1 Tax=Pseudonocardia terrae TaxID=2905831 RepID=UPI001E5592E1|nr:amidohydrolase family protein [Pseudonocardia terrae]MCE3551398.1 amidohydrolase family protein [Pseudonocardia terrae]